MQGIISYWFHLRYGIDVKGLGAIASGTDFLAALSFLAAPWVARRTGLLKAEHFAPVSHRQLLARMLTNLKGIYWQREAWDRVVGVIDRLLVLDPKAGEEWRDRGLAWTNMGELQRGLGDWERYLTEFPNATDHEAVKGQLRKTRQKLAQLN